MKKNKSDLSGVLIKVALRLAWAWLKGKIFGKPIDVDMDITIPPPGKRTILSFAINDYNEANDLKGCINDQKNIVKTIKKNFPEFIVHKYQNKEVTKKNFLSKVTEAILLLEKRDILFVHYSGHGTQVPDLSGDEADGYDEALYLYDGPLTDDDLNEVLQYIPEKTTVILVFDSCFSGTSTRDLQVGRFKPIDGTLPERKVVKKKVGRTNMKWIAFSGCSEDQVSYDAFIDGKFNGAFTYYFMKAISRGITYKEWYDKVRQYLPNSDYDQIPLLEGDPNLIDRIIFR